jgi:hypothetical protein
LLLAEAAREQQACLADHLPFLPQQVQIGLPFCGCGCLLDGRMREQRVHIVVQAQQEGAGVAGCSIGRKVAAQAHLRIGQKPGGKGLGVGDADLVTTYLELRVVGHRQHRHFGHVESVARIEAVARKRR